MRKLILLFLTTSAFAAPTFITGNANKGAGATTVTLASVTGGDTIIVGVECGAVGITLGASDNVNGSYTVARQQAFTTGNYTLALLFYANSAASASTVTITMTGCGGAFARLSAARYSGVGTAAPNDCSASATGTTGTSLNSGACTATAGDLVVGYGFSDGATTSAGSGFTARSAAITSDNFTMFEDQILSGTSAQATATSSASTDWTMLVAAFKPATAGSPAAKIRRKQD